MFVVAHHYVLYVYISPDYINPVPSIFPDLSSLNVYTDRAVISKAQRNMMDWPLPKHCLAVLLYVGFRTII